jgi:hypothetical protein
MHVLIINRNKSYFGESSWNSVSCSGITTRSTDELVRDLLQGVFGAGTANNTPITTGVTCPSDSIQVGNGCAKGSGGEGYVAPVGYTCSAGEFDSDSGGCKVCDMSGCDVVGMSSPAGTIPDAIVSNTKLSEELTAACEQYGVNCSLVKGIAQVESGGGKNCTTSPTGAAGCMQVLATTACTLDSSISSSCSACLASKNSTSASCAPVISTVSSNTQVGATLGVQYISELSKKYNGSCQLTAAAYFQGPGNVDKYNGVPPKAKGYVSTVCGSI